MIGEYFSTVDFLSLNHNCDRVFRFVVCKFDVVYACLLLDFISYSLILYSRYIAIYIHSYYFFISTSIVSSEYYDCSWSMFFYFKGSFFKQRWDDGNREHVLDSLDASRVYDYLENTSNSDGGVLRMY